MMQGQEITFLGGINTDDDVRFITDGDYRSSKYARTGSAEDQNMGALESMPGNILIDNPDYPDGVNTVIGSAKWIENNSIIYFVFNDQNNHSIWTYKLDTIEIKKVISNLTITFQLPPPLDPITIETYAGEALNLQVKNKIYHANVIDNILYWTDGFNPPRKLDINMAIKFIESQGLDEDGYSLRAFNTVEEASKTMDVLKAPPTVVIEAEYQNNSNKNFNKLYGNQYQFRYQYVYENNEESKWSMISKQPTPGTPSVLQDDINNFNSYYISGIGYRDFLLYNEIKLTYNTGSVNVKQINFAYRRGENGPWLIFKQLDKKQEGILTPYLTEELIFDDNTAPIGASLTDILYDNVPQTAKCQEILSNQSLAYANFHADYDLVENIDIQCLRFIFNIKSLENVSDPMPNVCGKEGIKFGGGSSGSYFQLNYVYNIEYRVPYSYYTAPSGEIISNQTPLFLFKIEDVIVFSLSNSSGSNLGMKNYYYTITENDVEFQSSGNSHEKFSNLIDNIYNDFINRYPDVSWEKVPDIDFNFNIGIYVPNKKLLNPNEQVFKILRKNNACSSLKKGSKKVFGIQYYDRGNRSNTVQTTPEMILDIPLPGQDNYTLNNNVPYRVLPLFLINHTPPNWATHYSILVKKDELISSFMQTTVASFRYDPLKPFCVWIDLDRIPGSENVDYYTSTYQGATFYHTPSKGDGVRFITKEIDKYVYPPSPSAPPNTDNPYLNTSEYVREYLELQVLEYDSSSNSILVNDFDYSNILGSASNSVGSLLEIYTPKKDVAEDIWYEIEKFDIVIGNDGKKYHGGNTYDGLGGNQTENAPAYVWSNYGDVYIRRRDLATGFTIKDFDGFQAILDSQESKILNVLSYDTSEQKLWTFTGNVDYYLYSESIPRNLILNLLNRSYYIEDFNYSDYYVSDGHGRGRIGIENNKTKRTHYKTGVIHSAPYVMESFINGLSSFDTLGNAEYLDDTFGPINRLKQVGYTLKALQDRKEVSIYIQRSYATSGDGSGQLAFTSKTFGGVNPSDTLYGCIHPGSVLLIENDMYYYDYNSGTVVRSSSNGQYDLTGPKYKFNYYLTNKTAEIGRVEQKDVFGRTYQSKYEPIAFVDEQNTEYTLNFVKYFYPVDKPAQFMGNRIYYQYDSNEAPVFDYLEDRWKTFVDYDLYWAETLGINVFTFKRDDLYEHNMAFLEDGTANELNFYGEQKTMSVEFVLNQNPIIIKRPLSIGLRSNKLFDLTKVSTKGNASYPVMESKLYPNNFKLKEGYWWSAYLRDMTNIIASKPSQNTADKALINGRELRGYAVIHNIEYTGNEKAILFDVKCSYVPSEAMI